MIGTSQNISIHWKELHRILNNKKVTISNLNGVISCGQRSINSSPKLSEIWHRWNSDPIHKSLLGYVIPHLRCIFNCKPIDVTWPCNSFIRNGNFLSPKVQSIRIIENCVCNHATRIGNTIRIQSFISDRQIDRKIFIIDNWFTIWLCFRFRNHLPLHLSFTDWVRIQSMILIVTMNLVVNKNRPLNFIANGHA